MSLSAEISTTTSTYYPHHFGAVPTYAVVAGLAIIALLLIRKLIGLAILAIVAAVAVALYHHGVLDQWFKIGDKKVHEVQTHIQTGKH
ncbi:MAG TPA: hypothetical protein VHE83_13250 [Mycobacteriales bacterium]|nr:hypothetical protein [Mycobacteriales bacterium]